MVFALFLTGEEEISKWFFPKQCGQLLGQVGGVWMVVRELKGRRVNMVGAKWLETRVGWPSWAGGRREIEDQTSSDPAEKDLTVPQAQVWRLAGRWGLQWPALGDGRWRRAGLYPGPSTTPELPSWRRAKEVEETSSAQPSPQEAQVTQGHSVFNEVYQLDCVCIFLSGKGSHKEYQELQEINKQRGFCVQKYAEW